MRKISGNLLFNAKRASLEKNSQEEHDRITELMKPENKEIFTSAVLSTELYPLEIIEDFITGYAKLKGKEELKDAVKRSARRQFKGFFGFSLRFLPPLHVIPKLVKKMWKKQMNFGKMASLEIKEGKAIMRIEDYDVSDLFLSATLWWFEVFFSKVLNKDVKGKARKAENITELIFS